VKFVNAESRRRQNRRGQGGRLRDEIVAAAAGMLEETGDEDAITLRGVARKVGIAAPSIYGHFSDVEGIVAAVVAGAFTELDTALDAAGQAAAADPEAHLRAVCDAYLRFAREQPHRYRVMFGRHRAAGESALSQPRPAEELLGSRAFNTLVGAVSRRTGTEPDEGSFTDATALWVALHGYASLQAAVPAFPWPDSAEMLTTLIERLIRGPGPATRTSGSR
jgi:AcrR family transcriptional regulator